MKRFNVLFLITVLFAPINIWAQSSWDLNWVKVDSGAYGNSYLDKPTPGLTMRFEDPKSPNGESLVMTYAYLVNFSSPNPDHKNARSLAYQMVFNCKTSKSAIQTMTGFSGEMARGNVVETFFPKEQLNWQTIPFVSDKANKLLLSACNSKLSF